MCGLAPGIPSPGQGSPTPSSSNIFFMWHTKPLTVRFLLSMQGRPCSRALLTLLDPFQKLHHRPHFSFPGLLELTDSRQTHLPHWPLAASIYFHIHTVALHAAPAPLTTCPAAQLGWGRLQTLLPPWLLETSIIALYSQQIQRGSLLYRCQYVELLDSAKKNLPVFLRQWP